MRNQRRETSRRLRLSALAIALAQFSGPAVATAKWFHLDENRWFPDWRRQVQELTDHSPRKASSQICVVGRTDGDPASLKAYVVWPSQHRLITWIPSTDDPHSLVHETHVLNLDADVVATERDVGGSTYLVTRAWLHDVERHCRAQGTTLTVPPSASATQAQR